MKLLAVSEHYFPRVGGTVNYVHETLSALAELGVEAELLVPGPAADAGVIVGDTAPYAVTWIDADYPETGDPSREARYDFCAKVDALVRSRIGTPEQPDLLHVLFGLFVMEVLDTAHLRANGLPCVATVHNVPPMECRQITDSAPLAARLREALRLRAVSWKNKGRLRQNQYDRYVVPSEQVRGFLTPIVGPSVKVIGHGLTSDLQAQMTPPPRRDPQGHSLRLLTVGGYAPHKRQHILPETAKMMRDAGLDFVWTVAGPAGRVRGYFDAIAQDLADSGLDQQVDLRPSVPFNALGSLYDQAHLYVQPSIEEGFCLTALDAAAVGLPVIGSPAGALPDIVATSGGRLVASQPRALAEAIQSFVNEACWQDAGQVSARVRDRFSWQKAANELMILYRDLRP